MTPAPKLRSCAQRFALGVPGSAIGMLAFQLAAVPVILAMLWTFFTPVAYFQGSGGVTVTPLTVLLWMGTFLVAIALFGTASLGGLVLGWRVANALGERIPLRAFLASDEIWQTFSAVFRRPYRLPFLLWLSSPFAFGVVCILNSGLTVADAPGAYRVQFESSEPPHLLDIKADGSWEYRRERQAGGVAAGTWLHEPDKSKSFTVVISFQVDARSSLLEGTPLARPGHVSSSISRDCFGRPRVCFGVNHQNCFERVSESKAPIAVAKEPQTGRRMLRLSVLPRLTAAGYCLL